MPIGKRFETIPTGSWMPNAKYVTRSRLPMMLVYQKKTGNVDF